MAESPFLSAIQALPGDNPTAKHKHLINLAAQISSNQSELEVFLNSKKTDRVEAALHPYLYVLVGKKIHSCFIIADYLTSNDMSIVKQVLKTKWFFKPSNPLMDVNYFKEHIFPKISRTTRTRLIKVLAKGLIQSREKSKSFFLGVAEDYRYKQALPFLPGCDEKFIMQKIIQHKIIFSRRMFNQVYIRHPEMMIDYLELGNPNNKTNVEDRKKFSFHFKEVQHFLPLIINLFYNEFANYCQLIPEKDFNMRLGTKKSKYFVDGIDEVQRVYYYPKIYIKLLSVQWVVYVLHEEGPELLRENTEFLIDYLIPEDEKDFDLDIIMKVLKYYPDDSKLGYLQHLYEKQYSRSIMKNEKVVDCMPFLNLLGRKNRVDFLRHNVYKCIENTPEFNKKLFYLDPCEANKKIKSLVINTTDLSWIMQMLKCYKFHSCPDYLLVALQFCKEQDQLEHSKLFHEIFCYVIKNFEHKLFDIYIWKELEMMITRGFLKLFLYEQLDEAYKHFFTNALRFFTDYCANNETVEKDKGIFDHLLNIIIHCYLPFNLDWQFFSHYTSATSSIKEDLLNVFLENVPMIKNNILNIQADYKVKLYLTLDFVKAMNIFNRKYFNKKKKKFHWGRTVLIIKEEVNKVRLHKNLMKNYSKFTIRNHPWLIEFSYDLLKKQRSITDAKDIERLRELRKELRHHDLNIYQNLIDSDAELINEVNTRDALDLLKRDPKKVLEKWNLYLDECRNLMSAGNEFALKFLLAVKWCREIPLKFVQRCKQELEVKGSPFVLAVLLEGELFRELVTPLFHLKSIENLHEYLKVRNVVSTLPQTFKLTNPVVFLEDFQFYQSDRLLSIKILFSTSSRIADKKFLKLMTKLINCKLINVKILIQLIHQTGPKFIVGCLMKIWDFVKLTDVSARTTIFKAMLNVFKQTSDTIPWLVLSHFCKDLTQNDVKCLEMLIDYECHELDYKHNLFKVTLFKLDTIFRLSSSTDLKKNSKQAQVLITRIIEKLDDNIANSLSYKLLNFVVCRYIILYSIWHKFPCYLFCDESKFNEKLNFVINIIKRVTNSNGTDLSSNKGTTTVAFAHIVIGQIVEKLVDCKNKEIALYGLTVMNGLIITLTESFREPRALMYLVVCKSLIETNTIFNFGEDLSEHLKNLINLLGFHNVTENIPRIIADVLRRRKVLTKENVNSIAYDCVQGLISKHFIIGSIISIKLISEIEIDCYNKFAELFRTWQTSKNVTIYTTFDLHLHPDECTITKYIDEKEEKP